jgi:hypothetical protein
MKTLKSQFTNSTPATDQKRSSVAVQPNATALVFVTRVVPADHRTKLCTCGSFRLDPRMSNERSRRTLRTASGSAVVSRPVEMPKSIGAIATDSLKGEQYVSRLDVRKALRRPGGL